MMTAEYGQRFAEQDGKCATCGFRSRRKLTLQRNYQRGCNILQCVSCVRGVGRQGSEASPRPSTVRKQAQQVERVKALQRAGIPLSRAVKQTSQELEVSIRSIWRALQRRCQYRA